MQHLIQMRILSATVYSQVVCHCRPDNAFDYIFLMTNNVHSLVHQLLSYLLFLNGYNISSCCVICATFFGIDPLG